MQRRLSSPRAAGWFAAALVFGLLNESIATPRRWPLNRRSTSALPAARGSRTPATPPPPPLPPVALQLTRLDVLIPVPRSAVVHAIARDAWPALVRCTTPPLAAHGFTTVEIRDGDPTGDIRIHGGPSLRNRRLTSCIRRAVSHVVLPPYEREFDSSPHAARVTFSLAFGMPPLLRHRHE